MTSIAARLQADGIDVWLDRWRLKPGDRWEAKVQEAHTSPIWLVFLGPHGLGRYHAGEVEKATLRARASAPHDPTAEFFAIPVLLPGALESLKQELPPLFVELMRVQFREINDDEAYAALLRTLSERIGSLSQPQPAEPLRILRGHSGAVTCVGFSHSGEIMASGGDDCTVRQWSLPEGRQHGSVKAHLRRVQSVAFSPDGTMVVSAGRDKRVVFSVPGTGLVDPHWLNHAAAVNAVRFDPTGTTLAGGGEDGALLIWDVKKRKLRHQLSPSGYAINALAWSNNGAVASGGQDNLVHLWDPTSGASLGRCEGHTDNIWSLAASPDGRFLASGSADQTVRVWSPTGSKETHVLPVQTGRGWRVAGRKETHVLARHTEAVLAVAFSPDGRYLVSGDARGTIIIWEVESGRESVRRQVSKGWVYDLALSPDGRWLACALDDGIALWEWSDLLHHETAAQRSSSLSTSPPLVVQAPPSPMGDFVKDPARFAEVLARLAFQDRARLRLCESPDLASVREALRAAQAEEAGFEERLRSATSAFEPNRLWQAWMVHVHGERLRQIGEELLRTTTPAAAAPAPVQEEAAPAKGSGIRPSRPSKTSLKPPGKRPPNSPDAGASRKLK